MSMLDTFFNKGFKGAKCKMLLKLTLPRIKLLRNKREVQLKQMRRDIAKLLETGQEATARIRVEHIIREENIMAAFEIIELFCELIVVRLPIIETQRECPLDLKEAISSLCFAAPRCADLPELQQVQMLFASKYGKEFVSAATELMPDCGVNRQIIELLSVRPPAAEAKLKLLKEIAEEHELDWDQAASETEYFKPHEDLLNGPSHFISGSKLPLQKEKHEDLISTPAPISQEETDSDTGFDSLDLPDVPKVSIQPNANSGSAPQMVPPLTAPLDPNIYHETLSSSQTNEDISYEPPSGPKLPSGTSGDKQFVPFMASPSFSGFSARESKPAPTLSRTKSEGQVDFQDVLAAAQAAAETAELAAAAARSAASLAQVRISELTMKKIDPVSDHSTKSTFLMDNPHSPTVAEASEVQEQFDYDANSAKRSPYPDHGMNRDSETSDETSKGEFPSFDEPIVPDHRSTHESETSYDETPSRVLSGLDEPVSGYQLSHQPQRSISMEEDPYFSYPNLFGSSDPKLRSSISSRDGGIHDLPTTTSSK